MKTYFEIHVAKKEMDDKYHPFFIVSRSSIKTEEKCIVLYQTLKNMLPEPLYYVEMIKVEIKKNQLILTDKMEVRES